MTHWTIRALLVAACVVSQIPEAVAWGPQSHRAIALAATSLIRQEFDDAFRADQTSYEPDLLRGAQEGYDIIRRSVPLNNDSQAMAAVSQQIHLLRAAREYGTGSFFAYRMGVLSALVADIVQPYGLVFSEQEEPIQSRIDRDLDAHLKDFSFNQGRTQFTFIDSPSAYFEGKRTFVRDDKRFIGEDYTRGQGYQGFLSEAAQDYFSVAVRSAADTWYSVFSSQGGTTSRDISPRILTQYFVREIGYLLDVKNNMDQAERAYRVFDRINPGIVEHYETIGDLFYEFGTEDAKERGVREWKIAQRYPGPQRRRAQEKLAKHYIDKGEQAFQKAQEPGATETDLQDALLAFENALEYDQNNDFAAGKINETTRAIKARKERYDTQAKIIDKALEVMNQAEQLRLQEDPVGALTTYNQALATIEGNITAEFPDLQSTAKSTVNDINKNVRNIIDDVINVKADNLIQQGDAAVEGSRYEEGINFYNLAIDTVESLPVQDPQVQERVQKTVERARTKISDAQELKKAADEQQQSQQKPTVNFPN